MKTKGRERAKQTVTPKAAIGILEIMAVDLVGAMVDMKVSDPMYDVLDQRVAAIDLAQEALDKTFRENENTRAAVEMEGME